DLCQEPAAGGGGGAAQGDGDHRARAGARRTTLVQRQEAAARAARAGLRARQHSVGDHAGLPPARRRGCGDEDRQQDARREGGVHLGGDVPGGAHGRGPGPAGALCLAHRRGHCPDAEGFRGSARRARGRYCVSLVMDGRRGRSGRDVIAGIQQIGLGVTDAALVFAWYRRWLGMDIRIFDETARARLMTCYTGGTVHSRRAILAVNLNGGAGCEIWQFTSPASQPPSFDVELGDLGILSARVKAEDVTRAHRRLADGADVWMSPLRRDPSDAPHFWMRDPWGNLLQVVRGSDWFADGTWVETGGRWIGL